MHGSCNDPGILILKDLEEYGEKLEAETRTLQEERGRQERLATSITDQMYTEAQVRHCNIIGSCMVELPFVCVQKCPIPKPHQI